jgi:hypothetical protein
LLQALQECREASLALRIVRRQAHEHADAPRALALLRARCERPSLSAGKQRDELAPLQLTEWHGAAPSWEAPSIPG